MEYEKIWYPAVEDEKLRYLLEGKACSSENIFLPVILQRFDKVINVDTDIIFLDRPENLWNHFNQLQQDQMIGMAPTFFDRLYKSQKVY